jgi:hypothetical protein
VGSSASNPTEQFWGSKQLVVGSSAISSKQFWVEAACGFISSFKADLRSEVLGLYFVFYPLNGSVRNSKEKGRRGTEGEENQERELCSK